MLCIVDYGAGNLCSVELAFRRLGIPCQVSADPAVLARASRIVFPGVGAAGSAMRELRSRQLADAIRQAAAEKPFLGICLGTQIILESSEEDGGVPCLGIVPGACPRFRFPEGVRATVPHMGWNAVCRSREHALFAEIPQDANFYFVHSYFPQPQEASDILAVTEHGGLRFCSAIARGRLVATQFHPEKSGRFGLQVLANFAEWDGRS
ncbi:MAG: imidazole glycerol phosphate synthase subunit HisH [Verrucomicrobiota bacterium]|jgi:glutamine amidotransferase